MGSADDRGSDAFRLLLYKRTALCRAGRFPAFFNGRTHGHDRFVQFARRQHCPAHDCRQYGRYRIENSLSREFETPQGTETRYTTDGLLRAEQTIFSQAAEMTAKPTGGQPYADLSDIRKTVAQMAAVIDIGANHAFDMPPEYLKIFDDFLKPANLRIANGPPGSGKSTLAQGLLFALTKDAVENGKTPPDFYAAAPSEKAAADIVGDMNMMKDFASAAERRKSRIICPKCAARRLWTI